MSADREPTRDRRGAPTGAGEGGPVAGGAASTGAIASAELGRGERIGYLGLGSNVGDRRAQLEAAVAALPRHGVRVLASSSTYETEPVGEILDQPDFLNAVARVRTALGPLELLDACKQVELELGRDPSAPRHSPRPVDLDLLLLGGIELEHDRLRLPHAEVTARRFVLVPLLELDPELTLPDGTRLAPILERLPGQRVERVGSLR